MADDLQKKFENFDSNPQQNRGIFLKEVVDIIRTTDVDQSLKDIVTQYDTMFGPDPTEYSRNALTPYFNALRKRVTELVSRQAPAEGSARRRRKTRKSKKSRRRTRRTYS
jgi:hypothetical protein